MRKYRKWLWEEKTILSKMLKSGNTIKRIASALNRTRIGIDAHLSHARKTPEGLALYPRNVQYDSNYAALQDISTSNNLKILLFDLETMPMICRTWGLRKVYLTHKSIIKGSAIVSWAAKWLYDDEIYGAYATPPQARNREDKPIIKKLWKLMDESDIIMAHNVKGFDRKVANTRFLLNKMGCPSPSKMIDTLLISRQEFRFPSNKLDFLSQRINDNKKLPTNMGLWAKCDSGGQIAKDAIAYMHKYNRQDLFLLEDLFIALRPWMKQSSNMALGFNDIIGRCINVGCGSKSIKVVKGKKYYTPSGRYQVMVCKDCGTYCRSKYQELSALEKKNLLMPISR